MPTRSAPSELSYGCEICGLLDHGMHDNRAPARPSVLSLSLSLHLYLPLFISQQPANRRRRPETSPACLRSLPPSYLSGVFVRVCFQIREWATRVGLDGAITNLPKMSSLILRWSLDNSTPPQSSLPPRPPPSPSIASQSGGGGSGSGCKDDGKGGGGGGDGGRSERARQRELRSCLQAFLEVRQVWRLLSGRGETDPALLSIAGESNKNEACTVSNPDIRGNTSMTSAIKWPDRMTGSAGGANKDT